MHTPLVTNGSQTSNKTGIIEVTASIEIGDPANGSELTYGITTASPSQLPAKISVFVDNGSVPGQLDINDQFLTATVTSSIGTNYTLNFTPYDKSIIIATKSVAGCVDNTKTVSNIGFLPLAISFIDFSVSRNQQTASYNWTIAGNENVQSFELQTSADGASYKGFKTVSPTAKVGIEKYVLTTPNQSLLKGYYRLKCTDKKGIVSYSHTQRISDADNRETKLTVLSIQSSQLQFLYNANSSGACNVRVYNINGSEVSKSKISFTKGTNRHGLTLDLTPGAGIYFLEVSNDLERTSIKFLKP